jgi:hypothetical protein
MEAACVFSMRGDRVLLRVRMTAESDDQTCPPQTLIDDD